VRFRGAQAGRARGRRWGPYVSHPRDAQREAAIEFLTGLPVVQEVAVVARIFRQDPARLLDDDGDEWPMLVRLAAARYVIRCEEAEAAKAKAAK
jgi:hypothetical protein